MRISFDEVFKTYQQRPALFFSENKVWLVELTSIEFPDNKDVEIVYACDENEAAFEAFCTRNIPGHWVVTQIEESK